MSIFALLSLFAAVSTFMLGSYIYIKQKNEKFAKVYTVLCYWQSLISFFEFNLRVSSTLEEALLWERINSLWILSIPLIIHFTLLFVGRTKFLSKRKNYIILYSPFMLYAVSNFFTPRENLVIIQKSWGFTHNLALGSPYKIIALSVITLASILPIYLIIRAYSEESDNNIKSQYLLVAISFFIPITMAVATKLPISAAVKNIPDFQTLAVSVECLLIAIAIIKYNLFHLSFNTLSSTLLRTIPDMLMIIDSNGKITTANELMCETTGFTKEELSHLTYDRIFDIDSGEIYKLSELQFINNISLSDIEAVLLTKSYEYIPVSISASIIENRNSSSKGILLVVRDISSRKIVEDALIESEKMLEAVMDTVPQYIYWKDLELKYIGCNKNFAHIVGLNSPEDVIGKDDIELQWSKEDAERIMKQDKEILKGELPLYGIVEEFHLPTGLSIWMQTNKLPFFNDNGKVIGIIGTSEDITERKKLEDGMAQYRAYLEALALARTEELEVKNKELEKELARRQETERVLRIAKIDAEQANKLKSEFVFNISHEMRTPLNCIIGFCEIIQEQKDIQQIKDSTNTILQESTSLLRLINDLLDHAKLEAGKLELEYRPVDLMLVLNNIDSAYRKRAEIKGLDFNIDVDDDVPRYIITDALRLRQILLNLISNAIKFTHQGEIRVAIEIMQNEEKSAQLLFTVSDTGIGIEKSRQRFIFDRFTQADGTTTRKFGGTGLGITISQQLTSLMGGTIGLNSTPGEGSSFWFLLDFELTERAKVLEELALDSDDSQIILESSLERKGHILMAEDYPSNQVMAKMHMESAGYTVDVVGNGKLAVDFASEMKYDLILLDVQMPELDGISAAKIIRDGTSINKETPILALTANADYTTRKNCEKAGMNDVITKPIRKKSFIAIIDKWILNLSDFTSFDINKPEDSEIIVQEDTEPIDLQIAIEEFGDVEMVKVIINQFLENVKNQFEIIETAINDNDLESIRIEAHSMKGGAATLEAVPLSKVAKQMEKSAKEKNSENMRELFDSMKEEYSKLFEYILTNLDTKDAA